MVENKDFNQPRELIAPTLKLRAIYDKLSKLIRWKRDAPGDGHIGTELGFAIEGVRCNGLEQPHSAHDVLRDFRLLEQAWDEHCRDSFKVFEHVRKCRMEAEALFKDWETCPVCKGTHGTRVNVPNDGIHIRSSYRWEDCETCSGVGMVKGN